MSGYATAPRMYHHPATRERRHHDAVAYPECAAWQTAIELEGLAARTRLDYLRSVAEFLIAYDKPAAEWTHLDLNDFLASKPAGSRRKIWAHLNSFFRWLEDEEIIDRNPMRKARRARPKAQQAPDLFTAGEIKAMCGNPLLAIMLHTGLRKGECRRLRRRHINLDRAELRVVDGKGGKDRVIRLNLTASKAVADIDLIDRIGPDDYLWWTRPGGGEVIQRDKPMGEASFARWWRLALRAVDVDYRNPHLTRHSFATRWLRAGGSMITLQQTLGHASIATTVNLYAHLDTNDAFADVLLLDLIESL